ncbi:uncharacterized protein BJ171DRAFT_506615 [Polychytrium aggregatum]|uniref:uncharacterized protein n=1 Tax=Polychytrium aggregatum TaxID=110093 RepID=UPI0022FDD405|nr:uncharacterized protein BJ171DRAFT_506615 [Polychytrium aggregatum]KAI9204227.1 hypothetical protein BJ171DRAFT_506615 [Polychytrium aggregatum]
MAQPVPPFLQAYMAIVSALNALGNVPAIQEQQRGILQGIRDQVRSGQVALSRLDSAVSDESRLLRRLQRLSFTKLQTLLAGTRGSLIEESQKSKFRLEQQYQQRQEQLEVLRAMLQSATVEAAELDAERARFDSLVMDLLALLDSHFAPPTPDHPENQAILQELDLIESEMAKTRDHLPQIRNSAHMMSEATRNLRQALRSLKVALHPEEIDRYFRNQILVLNRIEFSNRSRDHIDVANALLGSLAETLPAEAGVEAGELILFGPLDVNLSSFKASKLQALEAQQVALADMAENLARLESQLWCRVDRLQNQLAALSSQERSARARLVRYRLSNLSYEYESLAGRLVILEVPIEP